MNPILSFVVPVYNAEKTLLRCLAAVFHQRVEAEIVAVDDGSSDGSIALLERWAARYPGRIRVLRQEHMGPGTARNRGFREARGEFVWFLDADDWIAPGAAKLLCGEMERNGADLICFQRRIVKHRSWFPWVPPASVRHRGFSEMSTTMAVWKSGPVIYTKLFRRDFLARTGVAFPDMFGEDNLETPRIVLQAQKILSTDAECYVCRRGQAGRSSTGGVTDYAARTVGQLYAGFDERIRSVPEAERAIWNVLKAKTAEYMLKSANTNLEKGIGSADNARILRAVSARALEESWPQGGPVRME